MSDDDRQGKGARMAAESKSDLSDLPEHVHRFLDELVRHSRDALGDDLRSVVLFGSGAEGRLRTTSDVNVIAVLARFDREHVDRIREIVSAAAAAIRLRVMFLLETEVDAAARAFGVKFSDILHRHRVLFGTDPFVRLRIDRAAAIQRLNQVLLNLILRLREGYVVRSLREEQLATLVAEAAGPLRSAAASLLELEGTPAASPREALAKFATALPADLASIPLRLSRLREGAVLPAGEGPGLLFDLLQLGEHLRSRAATLASFAS